MFHFSFSHNSDSDDGGEEWPLANDSVMMAEGECAEVQRNGADTPLSPTPRPPSAGSQPKSPRARRQRTLSQSASSKAAATTTNQVPK